MGIEFRVGFGDDGAVLSRYRPPMHVLGPFALVVPVLAQAAPAAPAPPAPRVLVPPRLVGSPEVVYPKGARGDATVVVTVTVGVDGSVRTAHAVGDEPFASAAEQQIALWRFEPATRGGDPVSAVVRLEIVFHEPPPPPPPPSQPPTASAVAPPPPSTVAAPPPPDAPQEVRVTGERLAPAVSSFSRSEIRQLPGAFGDPFRAIEALPGVTPIISGLPFFYVRGAPPGNVGYFLDGVRVPYLYHIALGPSVIHPGMVERVDLYPGGYPARFGRFAGGIVAGEATAPRAELHGEGNVRLFDLGALVETGFDGGRGTVLVGGRYSYTAAIVSLIAKDLTLDYRDFQVRASYDVTPDDRVSVFSFGSYDLVGRTTNGILDILFATEFYRADVRWDHALSGGGSVRYAVTLGYDQSRINPSEQRNYQDTMLGARTEIVKPLDDGRYVVRAGVDTVLDMNRADSKRYGDPEDPTTKRFNELFPPRDDLAIGARIDVVMNLADNIELTPGVRVDFYSSGGATAQSIDPRLAARFGIIKGVRLVHAYGVAHQPPAFVLPLPGLTVGRLQRGLQSAYQASGGVEVDIDAATTATGTVFDNIFINMNDALGNSNAGQGADTRFNQRALGGAYGLELFLKRRLTKKLGGYVTYTLSRSTRSIGREHFPSAFDRTHVANAAVAYDLGRSWRAGTRLVFYTGAPKATAPEDLLAPLRNGDVARDPAFYRVDIRLEKRWTYSETRWLAFVFEVMNVTLHKETFGGTEIGPITIPSIGLEGGF